MGKINSTLYGEGLEKKGLQMRKRRSSAKKGASSIADIDVFTSTTDKDVAAIFAPMQLNIGDYTDIIDDEEKHLKHLGVDKTSGTKHEYVMWGENDLMPVNIASLIGADETVNSSLDFLKRITFGSGVSFCIDPELMADGKPSPEQTAFRREAQQWFEDNDLTQLTVRQARNFKTYGWNLDVIIINNKGNKITDISTRDVEDCRIAPRCKKTGNVPFAYYGKFNQYQCGLSLDNVEVIELLDERTPLRDLEVRMGIRRDPKTGLYRCEDPNNPASETNKCKCRARKFGILRRMQGSEKRVYPIPAHAAIFKGTWYRIKKTVEANLLAKLKNGTQIKYIIRVHQKYWESKLTEAGIMTGVNSADGKAKIAELKQKMSDFVCGGENTDKTLFSGKYTDIDGKEINLVEVENIDNKTQGGDWATDITEATNMICYGMGIHPTLVGAVPGKSTQNNSGSDKRELYTIAQANETVTRQMMMMSYNVVLRYNGWAAQGVIAHIPFMQLTTLDEHRSAKEVLAE